MKIRVYCSDNKMAGITKWRLFVFFTVCLVVNVEEVMSSAEVMKKLTTGFASALDQCKNELNVKDEILQDFYNFWKEDYALVNREMGCVLMCLASKFNLITEDLKMHHVNAHEFAKSHGADEEMAKQLVAIIHDCEKTHEAVVDDCSRVLEMAKCFKTRIHDLKWAPSMEEILEEVMTELEPK